MSDNIKVVVKVRPLISREINEKLSYQWRVENDTLHQLDQSGNVAWSYTFDKVYNEKTETTDVYNDVAKPIVEAAIRGINGTIFAYGQTSSGKTYTMAGTAESPGIIPLAVINLFDIIKNSKDRDFLVRVSYIEIYNDTIRDLLDIKKDNIKIHESYRGCIKMDVTEAVTSSPEEVFGFMKQGQANRQIGATNMNDESSRSHSIFQITIESREHTEGNGEAGCVNISTLNLVDLAGSERSGQAGSSGMRFKEGTHINKSLSALALVIKNLSEDPNRYINYRDSKLTRILQNSLGGNAETSIICAVTPAAIEETVSTLQFANRAKAIKNKPKVNEVQTSASMIQKLSKKLSILQSELETKNSIEQDNRKLKATIAQLQRQILNGFGGHALVGDVSMSRADRRKTWAAPRRMTIDTLHTIEESPGVSVPRFCTPALKYNPSMLGVPDFMPLPDADKMPRVSEESTSGHITPPPPKDRIVNFNDEIIELDSDGEETVVGPSCSPYHKCYESSKTPPCILREQAKKAERSYQDIIELTDREKIYKPDVVELMEKMEQNTNIMAKLEEEVNTLNQQIEERDSEISLLKVKSSKAEHDYNSLCSEKLNIETTAETAIKELQTKLTDVEVMYETLKRKSKTREDELLAQLNELRSHQGHKNIGKRLSKTFEKDNLNFMDLSKDISLVNSDLENSIVDDEASIPLNELLSTLNSQLSSKTEMVQELEAKLHSHQKEIIESESNTEILKATIAGLNEKLALVENENAVLKSSVGNLNVTIETLKESLETANTDNDSYNVMVKDLQSIIKEQDKASSFLDEIAIETMFANEDKLIANTENLRNIIRSLQMMFDARNEEIATLKSATRSVVDNPEIEHKQNQINDLETDVEQLKKLLNEKIDDIKKLTEENSSLMCRCEMQHSDVQMLNDKIEILNKDNEEATSLLEQAKSRENELIKTKPEAEFAKTESLAKEVCSLNEKLSDVCKENDTLTQIISEAELQLQSLEAKIEQDSKEKDDVVAEFDKVKNDVEQLKKLLNEKTDDIKKLTEENSSLMCRCEMQHSDMQMLNDKIEILNKDNEEATSLLEQAKSRENELKKTKSEAEFTKTESLAKEVCSLNEKLSDVSKENDTLTQVISEAELRLQSLEAKIKQLSKENEDVVAEFDKVKRENDVLKTTLSNSQISEVEFCKNLQDLQNEVDRLKQKISHMETEIVTKEKEIEALQILQLSQENVDIINTATDKIINFISRLTGKEYENPNISDIENIVQSLIFCANALAETDDTIDAQKEIVAKSSADLLNRLENDSINYQNIISALEAKVKNLTEDNIKLSNGNATLLLDVVQKSDDIKELQHKLLVTVSDIKTLQQALEEKNIAVITTEKRVSDLIKELENLTILLQEKEDCDELLNITIDKLTALFDATKVNIKESVDCRDSSAEKFKQVPKILDKVVVHFQTVEQELSDKENLKKALDEANAHISELKLSTLRVENELHTYKENYLKSVAEVDAIHRDNKVLGQSLFDCNVLLETLQADLVTKVQEMAEISRITKEFKDNFNQVDHAKQLTIQQLQADNESLRAQLYEAYDMQLADDVAKTDTNELRRSLTATIKQTIRAPQSLSSISFERVIEVMAANDWRTEVSTSESVHSFDISNKGSSEGGKTYTIESELKEAREDNVKLKDLVELLKEANKRLLEEQDEVRKELNLLLGPAVELQKKICNHRTNLSTLTATTFAEHKALQSQVKFLQHYHRRFHNVVQKDLPSLKKRLRELYTVLQIEAENNPNNSFKRFSLPDVLDKNSTILTNFRNDSTLDGDLLMLDTNVTLASVDGTLVGHEQDFDITQIDPETTYNSNLDLTTIGENLAHSDFEKPTNENHKMLESLEALMRENRELKEQAEKCSPERHSVQNRSGTSNSLNSKHSNGDVCEDCKDKADIISKFNEITDDLNRIMEQKSEVEEKYNKLYVESSSESLKSQLITLENEHKSKLAEITALVNTLKKKNHELKQLQEENDTLSTQVMENITEVDDLRKELDSMTFSKSELQQKCLALEKELESIARSPLEICASCLTKKKTVRQIPETECLLNRSRDIDTSLRYSKICTLQNELQASREDCKQITEEFATIKSQLERSNLSINQTMDDSMGESNIFSFTKDFDPIDAQNTSKFPSNMPKILEERVSDVYMFDKTECLNFFVEKTGTQKENLHHDFKIIDVIKMLYNNLVSQHGNEVENLFNQLRNLEESNASLESRIALIQTDYEKMRKELDDKTTGIEAVTKTLTSISHSIKTIDTVLNASTNNDKNLQLVTVFKENILNVLDREFTLSTTSVFDSLMDSIATKHQSDLCDIFEKYTKLQEHMENLTAEMTGVNDNLHLMKENLCEREKEYNLLKAQKDKVYEISNAVTLDIIKKEQELSETITKGCRKLLDYNIIDATDVDLSMPLKTNVGYLFEFLIQKHTSQEQTEIHSEKERLLQELETTITMLRKKEDEISNLRVENDRNIEIHKSMSQDLINKDNELQSMQSLRQEYEKVLSDQTNKAAVIQKLKDEIIILEETVAKNQMAMHNLESQMIQLHSRNLESQQHEFVTKIKESEIEISMLKSANAVLHKEKEDLAVILEKSNEIIQSQNEKLAQMSRELINLEKSVADSMRSMESLQNEAKSVSEENKALKEHVSRLKLNNTTHEKTVEIQSSMIKRLQKQNEEESEKYSILKAEHDTLQATLKSTKDELDSLQILKDTLEVHVTELKAGLADGGFKERMSIDAINCNMRRRHQSIHDSKRQFGEDSNHDHSKADSIFSTRSKPDDLFMDCEDDSSNRSSPARSSKRRESSLAKTDQSGNETGSRPSSVAATRIRRQSIHDLHRSVLHTPSPRESLLGSPLREDLEKMDTSTVNSDSEVAKLKSTLALCQQELEELKLRFKELDEECETCAEYLHERDEQCARLKKEKLELESTIATLKDASNHIRSVSAAKRSFADVSVNTDEDWTHLHAVVVDRMSFDAEVDKNKKLTRAIEEFRLKNRELKVTNAKMQRALDKHAERDHSGLAKELQETKQALAELQCKYNELDEECETCAEYLRERDEQIMKLKEAKVALEKKVQELQEAGATLSSRKKRQSLHDQNRAPQPHSDDAATETSDDLLSYQVSRDCNDGDSRRQGALAQQQPAAQSPVYVAQGSAIVQNQQITDIMKENQKLKKMNAKLINICKKRGKAQQDENDASEQR